MSYIAVTRNTKGIEFESIRKTLDGRFNDLHDELSAAYYDYWRKGLSKSFRNFNVQTTIEESEALFNELHGLLFDLRLIAFHDANMALPIARRVPETEYRYIHERDSIVVDKIAEAQAKIDTLASKGISIAGV
jgi:hypothetical protein